MSDALVFANGRVGRHFCAQGSASANTRATDGRRPEQQAVIVALAAAIERAKAAGGVDASANTTNSAVFFLLGLYAFLTTTRQWPARGAMIEDYLRATLRSMLAHQP